MSKIDTMYMERERVVTLKQLNAYSMNPFAFWGIMEDYIKNVHPLPIKYQYKMFKKDEIMDPRAASEGIVELYIYAAGYHNTKKLGDIGKIDRTNLNLFLQSYYQYQRPLPIDFVIADAIGVHIRTPGVDSERKNPLRDVFSQYKKG